MTGSLYFPFMNLLKNAGEAIEGTGTVRVVTSAKGNHVSIEISDNGKGMRKEQLRSLFDFQFSSQRQQVRVGMGLKVAYGIVQKHRGAIAVTSELGKGTSFHIYLPQADDSSQSEVERGDEIIPKGRERLLFVDDEREITFVAEMMLGKFGYDVTTKSCGVEALEEFRKDPQGYDVVITDHNMPKMTGLQLSRELIDIRPDIPVNMGGGSSEAYRCGGKEKSGIRESVMKPFSPNDLGKAIRRVLDEKGEVPE